jgi:hypothetical protein
MKVIGKLVILVPPGTETETGTLLAEAEGDQIKANS